MAGSGIRSQLGRTSNYVNGITPDFTLSERNLISPLYPLGDTQEYLLKNTIAYITTGSMPDLPQAEEQVSKGKIIYNSLIRRSMNGIRYGSLTYPDTTPHLLKTMFNAF